MTKLKELLKSKHIRQNDIAADIGIPKSTFNMWVNDNRVMGFDDAIKVADYLHCSLDELAGRETPERTLTEFEQHMIDVYNGMNQDGQTAMEIMIDSLASNPANRKKYNQVQESIS